MVVYLNVLIIIQINSNLVQSINLLVAKLNCKCFYAEPPIGFKSKTVDIKERKIAYKMEQNVIIFK